LKEDATKRTTPLCSPSLLHRTGVFVAVVALLPTTTLTTITTTTTPIRLCLVNRARQVFAVGNSVGPALLLYLYVLLWLFAPPALVVGSRLLPFLLLVLFSCSMLCYGAACRIDTRTYIVYYTHDHGL
jgi:hypothetical protein